ncbi:trypsin-like peptidase [Edaphobacter aggregans]|uniref:Trypsin-like peptidase n=1 Tax=Edaphobacter aggregans TaxID=570835 RepID=A0A428MQV0_9BACT|nr:trypsin-like peptidase domain-containing protein [Edaphobacter aggregans]RSL19258.1 trypsin-like peptidase [Edaphobacter aggregans]
MNRMRFAVLVFVVVDLCGLLVCGHLSAGQLPCEVEKSTRAQVVMVSAAEGACAAGIVVGFDAQTVYIATAAHIVGDLSVNPLPRVRIRFDGLSGDPRLGAISHFDPPDKSDLAVVNIKRDPALNAFLGQIDFHILSSVPLPQSDSPVHSIGCSGLTWWKTGNNETLLPSDHDYLRFHSDMEQGQSGGALYTEAWELGADAVAAERQHTLCPSH